MVSNIHEYDQVVGSKEITPASSSEKTYDVNEPDTTETSYSKVYDSSKNEEQMKSCAQHDGDNVEDKKAVEAIILHDNNESSHIEGEVNVCGTCGNLGYEDSLVFCCNCEVGAEHTYCMLEKMDKVPDNWSCSDCTEEVDGMQTKDKNEETCSKKRKAESTIQIFKIAEKRSPQRRSNFLNGEIADFDLNMDPNIELGEVPGIL